jgi:glycosyltransferase involved in cell wall biosynthesis
MRILHITSSIDPRNGGVATALIGLAKAQHAVGISVAVAANWKRDTDMSGFKTLQQAGIPVELIGPASGPLNRHPQIVPVLSHLIDAADVVHIQAIWEEIQHQGARIARRKDKPYLISPHGMLDPWSLQQSRWKKKLYMMWRQRRDLDSATALHFTTVPERDLTRPLALRPRAIIEPNGVDLKEFQSLPPAGKFRDLYPQLRSRRMVLFLSRLHHKKGLELLIPAIARCSEEVALVIAGPGDESYRMQLEQLVTQHHLQERVIFTGMLEGEPRIAAFADADLFALSSYQENFGNVVVEALAAGTPVIISDQVNLHAEITAAQVGEVVPLDVEVLATVLQRWLDDDRLRHAAAERARPFVWSHYDWQQIAGRWVDHYTQLIQSS